MFGPENSEYFARKMDGTPNLGPQALLASTPYVRYMQLSIATSYFQLRNNDVRH